jgi:two-component system chemotaxis response regulator CheB
LKKVRTLIVDDSATIRGIITRVLSADPEIEVVGAAGDPLEAREAIKALNPDVITLDVEMPKMTGIEFLEKIMRLRPMPVIMVSTLTQAGAEISLEALELGAFDCVGKPEFDGLPEKVKAAARARVRPPGERRHATARQGAYRPSNKVLAIGSSTGGVEALLVMLSSFPANCPPTLITQHMPATFTPSFAARLDRSCAPKVQEASEGAPIQAGCIYLAPGGIAHLEVQAGTQPRCRLVEGPPINGHRPSVDALFTSVAQIYGRRSVGVILTGMGRDGAQGLKLMREAGAATLGQDEASSVVYGMPKAAFDIGAVERQKSLAAIGAAALDLCAADLAGAA